MTGPITAMVIGALVAASSAAVGGIEIWSRNLRSSRRRERERRRLLQEQAQLQQVRREARAGLQDVSRSTMNEMVKVAARRRR
jgi:hypothetical protein